MSLLVLDPEIEQAKVLAARLNDLEFETISISDTTALPELCEPGGAKAIVLGSPTYAQTLDETVLRTGVPIILALSESMAPAELMASLPFGINDIWRLDMTPGELAARLERLCLSFATQHGSISVTVQALQSEIERDQRAGQYIQMGMLPPNPMGIGHYRLQHKVEPSLILSGDFIDYFQITDRYFACYVADVAGHGASSAFVTVLLKNFSRRLRREYRPSMLRNPGEILAWINRELLEQKIDKHVALFFGVLDMQESVLRYANAAQFPPPMIVVQNAIVDLSQKGKPLGLFTDQEWESREVELVSGARLIVFSDGVLDLVPGSTLTNKEQLLRDIVLENDQISDIWSNLDLSCLGADDVSCLVVHHEV
ncbi:MAG: PP2C family protein-serine/threonine phosphatase [Pseudomonadota bacterium]